MSAGVYLIHGDDEYLVSAKAGEILGALIPAGREATAREIIDGSAESVESVLTAVAQCLEALRTRDLFGEGKVVWLRGATFLGSTPLSRSDAVKDRLGDLAALIAQGVPAGQILVVTAPNVDKRSKFFKACGSNGEIHEFSVPDKVKEVESRARGRLRVCLGEAELRMSEEVEDAFLERVGTETRQIVNEVGKLALFLAERKQVTVDDVRAVTTPARLSIWWDLEDALGNRQLSRALNLVRQLLFQRESAIRLVIGLERRLRVLTIYREALDRGWLIEKPGAGGAFRAAWGRVPAEVETIFTEQSGKDPRAAHWYRVSLLAAQARLFTRQDLDRCRRAAVKAHLRLVSSRVPDAMTLELLLVEMLA